MKNRVFIENFAKVLEERLPSTKNVVITGDMKIHVNDPEDSDALLFTDMLTMLGLKQHVSFLTHTGGNILDLVITNIEQDVKVTEVMAGSPISDHIMVDCVLQVPHTQWVRKTVTTRKVAMIKHANLQDLHTAFK